MVAESGVVRRSANSELGESVVADSEVSVMAEISLIRTVMSNGVVEEVQAGGPGAG